ncbi:AAA family ATPase [Intrasporangium sp. YIM S08009]|uniref:AAA family ATPase n=1 Tax=Intrasporangium zincisolvens TaxID=3080018 RepID=UPI002B05989A|nr:AAA family ATPase [Intrasporangium sp. YIM S08009]
MTLPGSAPSPLDGGRACLLVTGGPGAGKSTVARSVARVLSRSALVEGDAVARLVVGGYVWPLGEPPEEAARQVALCNDNICSLAVNIMAAGFTPVIDWIVPDAEQLEVYRAALGPRLRLVVLDPGAATCVERDRERPPTEQFAFDGHDRLRAGMWAGFGSRGWWLDSSGLDPDSTTQQILDEAYARASC